MLLVTSEALQKNRVAGREHCCLEEIADEVDETKKSAGDCMVVVGLFFANALNALSYPWS